MYVASDQIIFSKENLFQRKKSLTPTGDQTTAPTDGDEGPKLVTSDIIILDYPIIHYPILSYFQDWENTPSTPLVAKGGPKPKFVNPADKHAVSEGENGFITFTVEGNPAPTVEWFKGFKDLSVEPR